MDARPILFTPRLRQVPRSLLLWAVCLCMSVYVCSSQAQNEKLLDDQTQAYIALINADEARDAERLREAREHYAEALTLYRQIQKQAPDWNAEIINYRIASCVNEIESIQRTLRPPAASPSASGTAGSGRGVDYYQSKYRSLAKENQYLRSQIEKMDEELEAAEDAGELRIELNRLRLENAQLKSGQASAEDALQKDLQEARNQVSTLRQALDAQKQELAELLLIRDRYDRLLENQRAAKQEGQDQRAALRRLQSRVEEMQSTLADERAALQALRQQAAEAPSAEQISRLQKQLENETSINRQLVSQVSKADAEIDALSRQLEAREAEVTEFSNQISKQLAREQSSVERMAAMKQELDALQMATNRLYRQTVELSEQSTVAPEEKQTLLAEIDRLRQALAEANEARAEQDVSEEKQVADVRALTQRNASLQNTIQELKESEQALNEALQKAARDIRSLEEDRQQIRGREAAPEIEHRQREELEAQVVDLKYEITKLQNALAASSEDDSLHRAYEKAEATIRTLRSKNGDLQEQIEAMRLDHNSARNSDPEETAARTIPFNLAQPAPEPTEEVVELAPEPESTTNDILPEAAALSRALRAERQGDLETALEAYREVTSRQPDNMSALQGQIRILLQTDQARDSLEIIEQAKEIDVKDLDVHLLEGMAWYQLGNYRRAGSVLRKLVRKNDSDARAHNALGAVYMAEQEYNEARVAFSTSLNINPQLSDAHFNMAQVIRITDPENRELAESHYTAALARGAQPDPIMEKYLSRR